MKDTFIYAICPSACLKLQDFNRKAIFLTSETVQKRSCITPYFNKTCSTLHFMTVIIIVIKDNSCYGDIIVIKACYFKNDCSSVDH